MKVNINIFNDSSYKFLPKKKVVDSINNVFRKESKCVIIDLNIIYVNDDSIKSINRKYLSHNRTTDVITFSMSENEDDVLGEIYISVDTAKKQADEFEVSLSQEIMRLAIHGSLHLVGYNDDTKTKRLLMHNLENKYLEMI